MTTLRCVDLGELSGKRFRVKELSFLKSISFHWYGSLAAAKYWAIYIREKPFTSSYYGEPGCLFMWYLYKTTDIFAVQQSYHDIPINRFIHKDEIEVWNGSSAVAHLYFELEIE